MDRLRAAAFVAGGFALLCVLFILWSRQESKEIQ